MTNLKNSYKTTAKTTFALLALGVLAGCNTEATISASGSPAPAALNGTWASTCEFNPETGFYETIDYDIINTSAAVLVSSYDDRFCTVFVGDELFEGTVNQTGDVILANGLDAAALSFSVLDSNSNTRLEYTSYFTTDPFTLYEYTETNAAFAFEYTRVN